MSIHSQLTEGKIHIPHQWTFATQADRIAAGSGFNSASVGKLAKVTADNTLWILTNHSPMTWQFIGGGGMGLVGRTVVAGSVAASISVSSIPPAWRHLRLVFLGRSDAAGVNNTNLLLRFNADTGSNYDWNWDFSFGSTASAAEGIGQTSMAIGSIPAATSTANVVSTSEVMVPNYAGTTFHKALHGMAGIVRAQSSGNVLHAGFSGNWRNTAAITSVTVLPAAGNLIVGSELSVYGIA